MALKTYTPAVCIAARSSAPSISINVKSGLFNINPAALELMGIDISVGGGKLKFHNDDESPADWYISVAPAHDTDSFELRVNGKLGKGLYFNNVTLAKAITGSVDFEEASCRVAIAKEPTDLEGVGKVWVMITAGLKNKK